MRVSRGWLAIFCLLITLNKVVIYLMDNYLQQYTKKYLLFIQFALERVVVSYLLDYYEVLAGSGSLEYPQHVDYIRVCLQLVAKF